MSGLRYWLACWRGVLAFMFYLSTELSGQEQLAGMGNDSGSKSGLLGSFCVFVDIYLELR